MASKFDNAADIGLAKDPMDYITNPTDKCFHIPDVSLPDIVTLIAGLNNKKSSSHDLITNGMLKATCHIIAPFLVTLYNKCLSEGVFPKAYKTAQVIPLFKGGDRENVNSYRPISLLPVLGKLLEKLISKHMSHVCF